MYLAMIVGALLFWAFVAVCVVGFLTIYLTGFARSCSLQLFLYRLRRGLDGGWNPYKTSGAWVRHIFADAYALSGFPYLPAEQSWTISFRKKGAPIRGVWRGFGDWEIHPCSPNEQTAYR